jgi:hypothetical protein
MREWILKYITVACMRSGTCRMLKLSTNAYVPFLVYAVITSAFGAMNFKLLTN